ncbi:MAG: BamA/TamA family outer membrane protein [Pseudomonadales bacterium]|nr:BamA/TamA family outer membrane protein [Pseudomonadales bacterium]
MLANLACAQQTRPVLPVVLPEKLPAISLLELRGTKAVMAGQLIIIKQIIITGNHVLAPSLLAAITAAYTHREIGYNDLLNLRDEVTLAYVNRGFVTSGAIVPDQDVADGVLEIHIQEGHLGAINISADRFRPEYIQSRLSLNAGDVVNVKLLETKIRQLQQDFRIDKVALTLVPTEQGNTDVKVQIAEAAAFSLQAGFDNTTSPAVGSDTLRLNLQHANLLGYGDVISFQSVHTPGLAAQELYYTLPVTAHHGQLLIEARNSDSDIVDDLFSGLDIEGASESYSLGFKQPFQLANEDQLILTLKGEFKRAASSLLGQGFSFSPGADDGETRVAALRFSAGLSRRRLNYIYSLHSTLSVGTKLLDATAHSGDTPDSQFVNWLVQAQWARRFTSTQIELRSRVDLQVTDSSLLGLEQFVLGGSTSVRGYRENLLARDAGITASFELRYPLYTTNTLSLDGAVFLDAGYGRNVHRAPAAETLTSVGIGFHIQIYQYLNLSIEWAEALQDVGVIGEHNRQDDGVHFGLNFGWAL